MPLAADVDIPRLAETTHGFTGADVAALCREAAMAALRRVLPKVDLDAAPLPYEQLLDLYVSMSDFYAALKEVEPSALREVMVEVPEIGWDDIGGLSKVKQELREIIEWPSRFPELFQAAQVRPPKGILLQGPPGAGKTLLAKAVARQGGLNFISIKGPGLISKYVGESERGIRPRPCSSGPRARASPLDVGGGSRPFPLPGCSSASASPFLAAVEAACSERRTCSSRSWCWRPQIAWI